MKEGKIIDYEFLLSKFYKNSDTVNKLLCLVEEDIEQREEALIAAHIAQD